MAKNKVSFGPFGGELSGIDPRGIPPTRAAVAQNVHIESGFLKPHYGFRNIRAIPAGFTAAYGLEYLNGYTSAGVEKEEYVSIETRSGNTRPYSINVTTGVSAEIKNGVTSVALAASPWKAFAFDDKSYWYNPVANKIARHLIGDNTSWVELSQPAKPTTVGVQTIPLSEQAFGAWSGGAGSAFTTVTALVATTSYLEAQHAANTTGTASFTYDLNGSGAGIQDMTYQDVIYLQFLQPTAGFRIDPDTVKVEFINNDGAPLTLTPSVTEVQEYDSIGGNGRIWIYFDKKTRTDFDNIRKIRLTYTITNSTGTATNNLLRILQLGYRRIDLAYGWDPIPDTLTFGYTYYNSAADIESDLVTATAPRAWFDSARTNDNLGDSDRQAYVHTAASSDPNVDKIRVYYLAPDDTWRRIGEQADTTIDFNIAVSNAEALDLPEYEPSTFKTDNCTCAGIYKGWVVWGYKGRFENVRHSSVGEPEKQYSGTALTTNLNRGANFSMRQDDPVAFHEADDALIILCTQGVYAQVPLVGQQPVPTAMTPPKRLPGAKGLANPFASCRWRDAQGFAGVAFLDLTGELYLAVVSDQFDGSSGYRLDELSAPIRGTIGAYLRDGQGLADFSTARLAVDEATDSLVLVMGKRGIILSRPSLTDGERPFVRQRWTMTSGIGYLAYSPRRRQRWLQSTGEFDENQWNSATGAWIEGANRHGGAAMPADSALWTSPVLVGPNTRAFKAYVKRDSLSDQPKVTLVSTRQTATYTVASGHQDVRFSQYQQGREHQLTLSLPETCGPVRGIELEIWGEIQKQRVDHG